MNRLMIPTPPLASLSPLWRRCRAGVLSLALGAAFGGSVFAQNAIFTTDITGTVNQNGYNCGSDVYLNGGPSQANPNSALPTGYYYFQVTSPSGKTLLSTDCADCRLIHITDGLIDAVNQCQDGTPHATIGTAPNLQVQLFPFGPTPDLGGVYKVDLISTGTDDLNTALGIINSGDCHFLTYGQSNVKSDNFKVTGTGTDCPCLGQNCPPEGCITECPDDIIIECGSGGSTDPTAANSPVSNCALSHQDDLAPTSDCGSAYHFSRIWFYSNGGDVNHPVCVQTVKVVDTTKPTISAPGADKSIACGAALQFDPPTPSDTCDQNVQLVPSGPVFSDPYKGTYTATMTWYARDACGNTSSSVSQTITISECKLKGALTIGYWQNNNGQGIIKNGATHPVVCNSKTINVANAGTWLRNFSPFMDLSDKATDSDLATYVYNVIKGANAAGAAMNAMLKAQMLATALDVYYSDPALGGNKIGAPAPIGGLHIDLTYINKPIGSATYEITLTVFGGTLSPVTGNCQTVIQLLNYAAGQSNSGGSSWYGQVKTTQELAKDTFDAINNSVAVLCP